MIIQRAWTFVPDAFHHGLVNRAVRQGRLDIEALWHEAVEACRTPSPASRDYLQMAHVDLDDVVIKYCASESPSMITRHAPSGTQP